MCQPTLHFHKMCICASKLLVCEKLHYTIRQCACVCVAAYNNIVIVCVIVQQSNIYAYVVESENCVYARVMHTQFQVHSFTSSNKQNTEYNKRKSNVTQWGKWRFSLSNKYLMLVLYGVVFVFHFVSLMSALTYLVQCFFHCIQWIDGVHRFAQMC